MGAGDSVERALGGEAMSVANSNAVGRTAPTSPIAAHQLPTARELLAPS
jgi:hypothetical protein